jgi:ATP-dependent Clp protease ATP-binding subunit ClpC
MNPATDLELKKIVERAVRPVPAPLERKKRMRAELLAHVRAVFEEERTRGDDEAALQQTRERFGDPAKLAHELQTVLSRFDRLGFVIERLVLRRKGEAAWRCSLRGAMYLFAAHEVLFLILLPVFLATRQRLEIERTAYLVLCLATAISTAMFAGSLLTAVLRKILFHRGHGRIPRLIGVSLLAAVVVPACEFGLFAAVSGELRTSLWTARIGLPFAVLLPVALALLAWAIERDERSHSEWDDLKIEVETP